MPQLASPILVYARPEIDSGMIGLLGAGLTIRVVASGAEWTELTFGTNTRTFFAHSPISYRDDDGALGSYDSPPRMSMENRLYIVGGALLATSLATIAINNNLLSSDQRSVYGEFLGGAIVLGFLSGVLCIVCAMLAKAYQEAEVLRPWDDNAAGMTKYLFKLLINKNSKGFRGELLRSPDFTLAKTLVFAGLVAIIGALVTFASR